MADVRESSWLSSRRKRVVDLIVVIATLPVTLPLIAIATAISAALFRANPLFTQTRRGRHEQPIAVVKIRSLPHTFPATETKQLLERRDLGPWSRFVRGTHIDELPQILNVLAGTMSVVGPRPMIDPVLEELDDDDRARRAVAVPGLTGLWQVSSAGSGPLAEHPELDDRYIEHATFATDLRILAWTVGGLLGRAPMTPEELLDEFGHAGPALTTTEFG